MNPKKAILKVLSDDSGKEGMHGQFQISQVHLKRYHYFAWTYTGSPDHRGTEDSPGRVCTVLPSENPQDTVEGTVYKVSGNVAHSVMDNLLHREKAGYSLQWVEVFTHSGETVKAILFTATEENEYDTSHALKKKKENALIRGTRNSFFADIFWGRQSHPL